MNDIFAKIISREIPADIVYEDDRIIAFLDIKPIRPGHALVVPKKWSRNLFDMDDETGAAFMRALRVVARAVKEATGAEGINIGINNEHAAGQIIFHAHAHVIPRFEGDGLNDWKRGPGYREDEAAALAEKIHTALDEGKYQK